MERKKLTKDLLGKALWLNGWCRISAKRATAKQADLRLSAWYSAEFAEALFNLAADSFKRYNAKKHPDSGIKDW